MPLDDICPSEGSGIVQVQARGDTGVVADIVADRAAVIRLELTGGPPGPATDSVTGGRFNRGFN